MNHPKNTQIKKMVLFIFFATVFILVLSTVLLAQPGIPSAPSQAPIEGGLAFLAVAGGGYAFKKLHKQKA